MPGARSVALGKEGREMRRNGGFWGFMSGIWISNESCGTDIDCTPARDVRTEWIEEEYR